MTPSLNVGASMLAIALAATPASATVSSAAQAPTAESSGVLRIFDSHPHPTIQRKTSTFAINPELGRAWVEVTFDPPSPEDRPDVVRVQVPGLSYDADSGAIVFRKGDAIVECARVEPRGIGPFKRHAIAPTGRCELTHRYVQAPMDDGFVIENVRRFEVHLKTVP